MIRRQKIGFTLIELLVVISIISLLIAVLLPALSQARKAARNVQCLNQQRQMAVVYHSYLADNRQNIPTDGNWGSNVGALFLHWCMCVCVKHTTIQTLVHQQHVAVSFQCSMHTVFQCFPVHFFSEAISYLRRSCQTSRICSRHFVYYGFQMYNAQFHTEY